MWRKVLKQSSRFSRWVGHPENTNSILVHLLHINIKKALQYLKRNLHLFFLDCPENLRILPQEISLNHNKLIKKVKILLMYTTLYTKSLSIKSGFPEENHPSLYYEAIYLPTTVGSRSTNTALGTCFPAPVSLKNVVKDSSELPTALSLGI